jgi:hypothetical protein
MKIKIIMMLKNEDDLVRISSLGFSSTKMRR